MMPGGAVHNWTNRFTGRIRSAVISEAPANKRPRWGHYGKPLKTTIVSARPRFWSNGGDKQRIYAAVGSTAPHAYYVDQGTGVFAGKGPYKAKVLPPWLPVFDLYEHTWRPNGPDGKRVKPVFIKGQKGQKFFEKGLARAFASMRMRSFQVPGEPSITKALGAIPTGDKNFMGNTPADGAFVAQLQEWRALRDERWNRERSIGPKRDAPKSKPRPTPKAPKPKRPPKSKPKPKPKPKGYETLGQKRAAAIAVFKRQNPGIRILSQNSQGLVVRTAKGPYLIPWSRIIRLAP